MRKFLYENSLSLVLLLITVLALVGNALTGHRQYNEDQQDHGQPEIGLTDYLTTGHFAESVFENWESEFLQMGCFVLFTIGLRQKGSSESKSCDKPEEVDREPDPNRPGAPWPVRRGGWVLALYRNSLTLALFSLFLVSFWLHAWGGARAYNHEQELMGKPDRATTIGFLGNSEFWFQSFENWQSEFLSVATMVVLAIFLRQKGSSQSKPVDAPNSETGE